jgi:hypothetical protein
MKRAGKLGLVAMIVMTMSLMGAPVLALDASPSESRSGMSAPSPYVMAYDSLDLEDHQGYSSEYIFGLTKGVMRSTMVGALKPMVLLLTVPLDIAFLPFAAIGGFFR